MAVTIDRLPETVHLKYKRGDEVGELFTLLGPPDGNGDREPIDITGNTYRAQMRRSASSSAYVSLTVDVVNPTGGQFVLRLDSSVTATLSGNYEWDLEQNAGGVIRTLLAGRFTAKPDVTRDPM